MDAGGDNKHDTDAMKKKGILAGWYVFLKFKLSQFVHVWNQKSQIYQFFVQLLERGCGKRLDY